MKPRKKNVYATFIFSFLPGAAEMYMGFMKNGMSLLAAFLMPILATGILYWADYLAIISGIIYVVAFFHARNLATAPDDEFDAFTDKFIWEEFTNVKFENISTKLKNKWVAYCLIFIGACGVWTLFRDLLFRVIADIPKYQYIKNIVNCVPRLAFSILVIAVGVMLIKGKKKELLEENTDKTN